MEGRRREGRDRAVLAWLACLLVFLGGAPLARAAEPSRAQNVSVAEHEARVKALRGVAQELRDRCTSGTPAEMEKEVAAVEEQAARLLGEKLAALDKEIAAAADVLRDPQKNDGQKEAARITKQRAEAEKKVAEEHVMRLRYKHLLTQIAAHAKAIDAQQKAIDAAQKVLDDTAATAAAKASAKKAKEAAEKAKETAKKANEAAESEKATFERTLPDRNDRVLPWFKRFEQKTEICKELCSDGDAGDKAEPINFCAFRAEVPATAAVIADWASADALIQYIGIPRRRIEAAFEPSIHLEVTVLPGDPFAKTRPGLPKEPPKKAAAPKLPVALPTVCISEIEKGRQAGVAESAVAVATGLHGIDLTAASAQTAEVALAALAKVIEDRAKREALVWFLQRMHEEVCGTNDDVAACEPPAPAVAAARAVALKDAEAKVAIATNEFRSSEKGAEDAAKGLTRACGEWMNRKDEPNAHAGLDNAVKQAEERVQAAAQTARTKWAALREARAHLEDGRADSGSCKDRAAVLRDVRTYWLPTTCALARDRQDYVQYGGGASLLRALQGAVATDVRGWPGVAAGVGAGAVFWTSTDHYPYKKDIPLVFRCEPAGGGANEDPVCRPTVKLRRATARLVGDIQGGKDPLASLYRYGSDIDDLNNTGQETVHNRAFQTTACIASLPEVFNSYSKHADATVGERKDEVRALLLAGLAGSAACWTVTGQGWDSKDCKGLSSPSEAAAVCSPDAKPKLAVARSGSLERLTTILRWSSKTGAPMDRVVTQWEAMRTAWDTFFTAFEALKKAGGGAPFVPPPFDKSTVNNAQTFAEVLKAFDEYVKTTASAAQQAEQVKLVQAAAALARASLDLGVAVTSGLAGVADEALYPGLRVNVGSIRAALEATAAQLGRYSQHVATAESAIGQDWGAAVAKVVAIVRVELKEECDKDQRCSRLVDRLSRYSGLFAALLGEKDPEKVAEALDAAAMPIGGWRHKQIPGAGTLSLAAFPGFGTGAEVRHGQYGVVLERGKEVYWAAPTLQMPLGVDLAYGTGCDAFPAVALFMPVLDPAAYLHYDPDKGGRLPGAQLLTALSPGLSLRVALGRSPFSFQGGFVVRPNFRAWESDVASPGATAVQFLGSLAVDVTLLELWTKRPQ